MPGAAEPRVAMDPSFRWDDDWDQIRSRLVPDTLTQTAQNLASPANPC